MEKESALILVVDDSATMRLLTCEALTQAGFTAIEAENGEKALALLQSAKPDAVLLDVEMPGLDGFAVCTAIRKLPEHRYTPVMMVTSLDDYDSINKAFLVGATDFVTKPVNANLLGYRVRYMVRTSSYFDELQQNNIAISRFVPQNFLKMLNRKNITDIRLGDCIEKVMTVLFLDIKSFTSMAEQLSSVEIFNLFNSLMSYFNPVILKYEGFIDKYIGDAIMALFEDADNALKAALGMLSALDKFNKQREKENLVPVSVGIGINTGSLIVGTVGFETRMDCSVISDAVNIGSRVETLTREFDIDLLISSQTHAQLTTKEKYFLRDLGLMTIKGKAQPIKVYEVFNHCTPAEIALKKDSIERFAEALEHYANERYAKAIKLFEQITMLNPKDRTALYFLEKCKEFNPKKN